MKIYYIGNGFDLAHSLPTSYLNFKNYFKKNYPEFYNKFIEMYGLGSVQYDYNGPYYDDDDDIAKEMLWMDFENTLAKIDNSFIYGKIENIQEVRDLTQSEFEGILDPDPRWYHDIYIQNMDLYELYKPLQRAFIEWIIYTEANYDGKEPLHKKKPFYPIKETNSYFISFNYTHTLQKKYKISNAHIFYPHGEAGNKNKMPQFGHGNENASRDLIEMETYDKDSNYIVNWLTEYLERTRKDVNEFLYETRSFLEDIEIEDDSGLEINILGCSFSEVDIPYFRQANDIFPNAKWNISYYSDEDRDRIEKFISDNNLQAQKSFGKIRLICIA